MRAALLAALLCVVGHAGSGLAQFDPARTYRQSDAVKARYPDPPVAFTTPGFREGRTDFTSHEEMLAFVHALERDTDRLQVRTIGRTRGGRDIPMLVLSSPSAARAVDVLRLGRPVVFLQGLQHGNEPAGGEAMLVLAQELAAGSLRPLLERVSVVIVPHANPDGSHRFTRSPPGPADINRDHVKLDLPETIALRAAIAEYQPEVFIDAHEFSVATRWVEKFGVLQATDVTLQHATHPNVDRRLTEAAERWLLPAMRSALERAGYTHDWYYTTSYDPTDRKVSMGGVSPDIGRNTAGLGGAISFLVESRGVGVGRDAFGRRVHSHVVAVGRVLAEVADRADEVVRLVREVRAATIARGLAPRADDTLVVTQRRSIARRTLPMLDPQTGDPRAIEVDWEDALAPMPVLVRPRPYAYVMPPEHADAARRLADAGVVVRRLRGARTLEVEAYDVKEKRVGAQYREGRIRVDVTTETRRVRKRFEAGSYVYLMAQPAANLVAIALEPESESSFVAFGLVAVDRRGVQATGGATAEVPVYRVTAPVPLDAAIEERSAPARPALAY